MFDDLDHATRWHYLMLIQLCSRSSRHDGTLPLKRAVNCSDVEDQTSAVGALIAAGLLENVDGATVRVVRIAAHVPSADLIAKLAQDRARAARHRKHKAGDHSDCDPDRCSDATPVLPVTARPVQSRASREDRRDASRDGLDDDEQEMLAEYFADGAA